jgi:hypothetical protein
MRLICPSCGAIHSAESWANDVDTRQCMIMVADLPGEVSRRCLNYLALFRPGTRALIWSKALRLLKDLSDLVRAPEVMWEKKPSRPNTVMVWALALDRVIEHPPKRLPLTSHGYLRAIAWEIADEMDRGNESRIIRREHAGDGDGVRKMRERPPAMTVEQMRAIREKALGTK